jgi:hypothetical protein
MKPTKLNYLSVELEKLQLGESLSKKEFVKTHWHTNDYFTRRSFDVILCRAKKLFPNKDFDSTVNQEIKRIK